MTTTRRRRPRGRLALHDLQQERLIGPFQHQRRWKGRDGRTAPPWSGLRARRPAVRGDRHADAASNLRPGGEATARGKRGSGADPRGPRAARRAARLQERSVRGPAQVAPRRDRGHARPLERRPPRLDRGPPRGRGPDRARRAAQRRQVVAPPGAVRDPDQDRRLPVHDAPPGAGADPDRRRARPARRDPGADRGRVRGPRRRPGAARRAAHRRRDRLLRPRRRRSGGARGRPRRGRRRRDRQAGLPRRDARRRGTSRGDRPPAGALPDLDVVPVSVLDEATLDAFRAPCGR